MRPDRKREEELLQEAETRNPGAWGDHSRTAARCAEKIASRCGLDPDKAYVLGLLHDIGRRFGHRHLGHVADGYAYMMSLGYDEVADICLSHSFNNKTVEEYIGSFDVSEKELQLIKEKLAEKEFDDYDRLIQLCDAIAGPGSVMDMEERMEDVRRRYGSYPQAKRDSNLFLKQYFEEKMQMDLYDAVKERGMP